MTQRFYLDHNSTTPLYTGLFSLLEEWKNEFGNPSSVHFEGQKLKNKIRESRSNIAEFLGASSQNLFFTSGGTESNNTAIWSSFLRLRQKKNFKNHFICSAVEHPSVLAPLYFLQENFGLRVSLIPVKKTGELCLDELQRLLSEKGADWVGCSFVQSETGVIHPVSQVIELCRQKSALIHIDGVQALGKVPFRLDELQPDTLSLSAHKCGGLKGTGLLFIKNQTPFYPFIQGGGQERGRRAGTENTLGILAFGECLKKIDFVERRKRQGATQEKLESLLRFLSGVYITGKSQPRVSNTTHIRVDDVSGESLLMNLDLLGYSVSTGAACSSGSSEPSRALMNMGFTPLEAQGSIRISLGEGLEGFSPENFIEHLRLVIERIRMIGRGGEEC